MAWPKGRPATPAQRAAISRAVRAALDSPEKRLRWSVASKAMWARPGHREHMSRAMTARCADAEWLAKRSAAIKAGKRRASSLRGMSLEERRVHESWRRRRRYWDKKQVDTTEAAE